MPQQSIFGGRTRASHSGGLSELDPARGASKTRRMLHRSVLSYVGLAMLGGMVLCACGSDPKPPPYLGHWESLYRGRGGESNGLVIRADSTMDRLSLRAFDFRYSVVGDSLRMVAMIPDSLWLPGDTAPPVFYSRFSLSGDTLMQWDEFRTEWLVREGGWESPGSPLVGTWRTVRSTVPNVDLGFARFRADSVMQVRVPAAVVTGTYSVQADFVDTLLPDSICFYFPDDTSRCVLSWRVDTLVLTRTFTNGTFSFEYLHAGDTSWYRILKP